jgi:RHS repeat-associated protein
VCQTLPNASTCGSPDASVTSTYAYNDDGLRMSDTPAGGSAQRFTWDGSGSVPNLLEDGTSYYLYGPNIGSAPLEQISISGSTPTYVVSDSTGVRQQLSSTGSTSGSVSYDSYGTRCGGCSISTPFGFEGAYTDATGLDYLVHRYYDPSTEQFLNVDPLVNETGTPYASTAGDPVNEMDPSGLNWLSSAWDDTGGVVVHATKVAAVDTGHAVQHHWRGIVTGVGIVAGVAAAATGVGALAEGSIGLGLLAGGFGIVSGAADLPACIGTGGEHDVAACAGAAIGIASGVLGGAGAIATAATKLGWLAESGLPSIYGGLAGALGSAEGVGSTTLNRPGFHGDSVVWEPTSSSGRI